MKHNRSTLPYRTPRFIANPKFRWRPLTPNQSMLLIAGGLLIFLPAFLRVSGNAIQTGNPVPLLLSICFRTPCGLGLLPLLIGAAFMTWCTVNWITDGVKRRRIRSGKYRHS